MSGRARWGAALAVLVAGSLVAGCGGGTSNGAASAPRHRQGPSTSSSRSASASSPTPGPQPPAQNPGHLSDAQMVGQLFMTYVYGSGATNATLDQQQANRALYGVPTGADVVRRFHLGGIILIDHNTLDPIRPDLSTGNVDDAGQIRGLLAGLQAAARSAGDPVLLVSTDQEGGQVQRITNGVSPRPSELNLADVGPRALTCSYWTLGRQLRALGLNQDFAPDADVVRTTGGVIGDRSFGADPRLDGRDVLAATRGLQRAGVLATLKHWPGHGSTATDSHLALAVVHEDGATWRSVDRVPFADAARVAAAVMVGHLAVPALDPSGLPATFSPVLTRQLLVDQLGFTGLVVTDSLWMEPARAIAPPGPMAIKALRAGDDLLLEPPDLPASYAAVLHAVRTRAPVRALVRAAVTKVLAAKARAAARPGAAPPGCS